MRARSWMAALALIAGTSIAVGPSDAGPGPDRARQAKNRTEAPATETGPEGEAAIDSRPVGFADVCHPVESRDRRAWARRMRRRGQARQCKLQIPRPVNVTNNGEVFKKGRKASARLVGRVTRSGAPRRRAPRRRPHLHRRDHGPRARTGRQDRLSWLPSGVQGGRRGRTAHRGAVPISPAT